MKLKRKPTIRKRLAQQRPEIEAKREVNWNVMRERQRRTLAANAQAMHDRYEQDLRVSPHMDGLRGAGVRQHRDQLRKMLTDMNAFTDPWGGLPPPWP